MKIQRGSKSPTGNTEFKKGHIYKHVDGGPNENIYICVHDCNGETYGKKMVKMDTGLSYPLDVKPEYYFDITDQVSLQDIKK